MKKIIVLALAIVLLAGLFVGCGGGGGGTIISTENGGSRFFGGGPGSNNLGGPGGRGAGFGGTVSGIDEN